MDQPITLLEIDATTGIETIRALTDEELAEREAQAAQDAKLDAERQAKIAARESALAKLAALGLTQKEIDAL